MPPRASSSQYLDDAIVHLRATGHAITDEDLQRVSPLQHEHIKMLGNFPFTLPHELAAGRRRQLRGLGEPALLSVRSCSITTGRPDHRIASGYRRSRREAIQNVTLDDLHQFRKRGSRRVTRERGRLMASRKRLGGDVLPEPTRRANNEDLHRPFPFAQPPCLGSRRRHALLLRLPVSVHTQRSREGLADRMRVAAFRRTGDTRPSRKGFSSAGRVSQPRASRGPPTLHGARSCSSLSATPRRHRRRTTAASVPRMG